MNKMGFPDLFVDVPCPAHCLDFLNSPYLIVHNEPRAVTRRHPTEPHQVSMNNCAIRGQYRRDESAQGHARTPEWRYDFTIAWPQPTTLMARPLERPGPLAINRNRPLTCPSEPGRLGLARRHRSCCPISPRSDSLSWPRLHRTGPPGFVLVDSAQNRDASRTPCRNGR